jgi:hypothetical protein
MTDFSPNRVHRWPASSAKAFEVYHLGETEADIREDQDFPKLWATWHYDWSTPGSVKLTVTENRRAPAGRLHDAGRHASRRGRQCGGLRRFVILELGRLLGGHLADNLVDRPAERLNTETDCQRPQLTGLVCDRVPLPGR